MVGVAAHTHAHATSPHAGTNAVLWNKRRASEVLQRAMARCSASATPLPERTKQVDSAPFGMARFSAAVIMVGMTWLALDSAAAAQSCMCADPIEETRAERIEALSEELAEQLEGSLSEAAAPAIEIGLRAIDDDELPWCLNQNDARCSKLPAGTLPASIGLGSTSAALPTARHTLPMRLSVPCTFHETAGLSPREAARSKLERPPR